MEFYKDRQRNTEDTSKNGPVGSLYQDHESSYSQLIHGQRQEMVLEKHLLSSIPIKTQDYSAPKLLSTEEATRIQAKKKKKVQRMEKKKAKNLERTERMDVVKFLIYRCSFGKVYWAKTDTEENRLMEEKLKSGSDEDVNAANNMIKKKITRYNEIVVSLKSTIKRLKEENADTSKLTYRLADRESDLKKLNIYNIMITREIDRRKVS